MTYAETFAEQAVLGVDHVGVIVLREFYLHAVRGLGAFAVADAVWNDDEIPGCVERLARAEQFSGEGGREHVCRRAAATMQDQHRLAGRLAHRSVVQAQLRNYVAGMKPKVTRDPIALLRGGIVGRNG